MVQHALLHVQGNMPGAYVEHSQSSTSFAGSGSRVQCRGDPLGFMNLCGPLHVHGCAYGTVASKK